MKVFNISEKIRNLTNNDYFQILKERPLKIAEFSYEILDNKIYLKHNENKYELIPKEKREEIIKNFYKDPKYTGGYKKVYRLINERYAGISRQNVIDVIKTLESYQQRQNIKVRRTVRPIITSSPFERWQMDLLVFEKYAKFNNNYKYLLVVIDVFSKYTFIKILPDKETRTIALALASIFEETLRKYGKVPRILTSDNAKEFKSDIIQKLCKKYKVQQRYSHPYSPQDQAFVERRNRDIKNIIFKYFIENKTYRYIDIIDKILENINKNSS